VRQDFHIDESVWFVVAQDRDQWNQCSYVCCLPHYQYQCSCDCFVGSVIDFSGDLRIWLDTDVMVSDPDRQQGVIV